MQYLALVAVTLSLLLSLPTRAFAQDTTGVGVVSGTVVKTGGAPAPDVAVCVPALSSMRGDGCQPDVSASATCAPVSTISRSSLPSLPPLTTRVDVRAGRDAVVEVTLPATAATQETVTVTAPRFVAPEELKTSAFLVAPADISQGAGALQDVSRYLQSLPGVVLGTDDFRNDLIVRGGSSLENLYIVDNVEIPNINTFANFSSAGGTVSTIDSELLRDVTFLTGGYPAPYGNRTSSVLQLALREGRRDRIGGRATIGFAGAGGIVEGPINGGRGTWIASVRRSFLDLFTDDVGIGGVPVLYTFNGKATYDLTPRDRVWAVNISAVDSVRLGLTEDSDPTEELSNLDIRNRGRRSATGVNWQRTFGQRGVGLFGVSYGRASVDSRVLDLIRGGVPLPGTPSRRTARGWRDRLSRGLGGRRGDGQVRPDVLRTSPRQDAERDQRQADQRRLRRQRTLRHQQPVFRRARSESILAGAGRRLISDWRVSAEHAFCRTTGQPHDGASCRPLRPALGDACSAASRRNLQAHADNVAARLGRPLLSAAVPAVRGGVSGERRPCPFPR